MSLSGLNAADIGAFIRNKIENYSFAPLVYEQGNVRSVMDGVVQIDGLHSRYGEILALENDVYGMAMELREDGVGAVLLNGDVPAGSKVRGTGHVADVCVGDNLLGRVLDPLGRPLDGKRLEPTGFRPLEAPAPRIIDRSPVAQPLMTGILAVDSMIPVGRGQRELILGDRQTGKTALALSAMRNQKSSGVICVYCAIGQRASATAALVHELSRSGTLGHTVIVSSLASDRPAMQYLAPYAGCAIAEEFMYQGKDVLIVYDDLSKHAVAYRTMSLLLRRPSGREAYPGDVFYLHSRLLERAAKLSPALGGGSMTALPIVETMAGDISAYIPTNIISITDGQIHLETDLFNAGVRPAVNVGLSVSRVGRAAQHDAMKKVSASLRLDVAQYRDMAVFAQFGADIDASTRRLLERGARLIELLKQPQELLYSLSGQTAVLICFECGLFQDVSPEQVPDRREKLLAWLWDNCSIELDRIDETGRLTDEDREAIKRAARAFLPAEDKGQPEEAEPGAEQNPPRAAEAEPHTPV